MSPHGPHPENRGLQPSPVQKGKDWVRTPGHKTGHAQGPRKRELLRLGPSETYADGPGAPASLATFPHTLQSACCHQLSL